MFQKLSLIFTAWSLGLSSMVGNPINDPNDFPITVWLQNPYRAAEYAAAGFNGYTGMVKHDTWEEELAKLKENGIYLIACPDDEVMAMDSDVIMAWMHGDEPDNAQSDGQGGYGPPIKPEKIVRDYKSVKEKDPTRPVFLNLSMGVAYDGWIGRGVRTNHPEDYPEYAKGADIVSFDIYPVTSKREDIAGKLELVPYGVNRLEKWAPGKPVWTCIECTRINNADVKPTPHETRAMVWMALINGADGLVYFSHQFKPRFIEAGLLADAEMTAAVTEMNHRIRSLASVLKSPDRPELAKVSVSNEDAPVDILVKQHDGSTYVFAVNMRPVDNEAAFELSEIAEGKIEELSAGREFVLSDGAFEEDFGPYDVRLYKITPAR